MSIGYIPGKLLIPLDQPWSKDVRVWRATNPPTAVPLASAAAWLRKKGGAASAPAAPLELTVGNGRVELADNVVTLSLALADIEDLPPGDYDVEVQAQEAGGAWRQIRGVAVLVKGLGQ